MKNEKSKKKENGEVSSRAILLKAAAAEKLKTAARRHLEMVKVEAKQARKAFKQAKKAAKRARKEAKVAAKMFKANGSARVAKPKLSPARGAKAANAKSNGARRHVPQAAYPMAALTTAMNVASSIV